MKKEALFNLYAKYKLIIYPVLVGLASITLIALVILPQIEGYFKTQDAAEDTKLKLKSLEVKAKDLENVPEGDLKIKLQSANLALPSDKDYTSVIGLLQRLSAQSGVTLSSVNLENGKGKDIGGVSSFGVKVEITTTRSNFDEFLKNIAKAPIIMKVASMSVDTAQGSDAVSAGIVIDVYYSPTPKSLGNVEDPLPKLSDEEQKLAIKLANNVSASPLMVFTTPTTPTSSEQPPATILPRGKANPFE